MSVKSYKEEFRIEAVKQVTDRGYLVVAGVASRLGVTSQSLYLWIKRYRVVPAERETTKDQRSELRRLKVELKRFTEQREILKNPTCDEAKQVVFDFIKVSDNPERCHRVSNRLKLIKSQKSSF